MKNKEILKREKQRNECLEYIKNLPEWTLVLCSDNSYELCDVWEPIIWEYKKFKQPNLYEVYDGHWNTTFFYYMLPYEE